MSKWIEKWEVYSDSLNNFSAGSIKKYIVSKDAEDNFGCSCAAWKFQRGTKGDCKHIIQKKEGLMTDKLAELNAEIMHYYTYGLVCFLKELQALPLPMIKRTKTSLSFFSNPSHFLQPNRPDLLSLGVVLSADKKNISIDMTMMQGVNQMLIDTAINRFSFYKTSISQFTNFDFQRSGVNISADKTTSDELQRINSFLSAIEGAYFTVTCLKPLMNGIKDIKDITKYRWVLPNNGGGNGNGAGHKIDMAWPELITPKLFGKDNPICDISDFIKLENIAKIIEAFNSLLMKNYGAEYAALLFEDKMADQPDPLIRSFY